MREPDTETPFDAASRANGNTDPPEIDTVPTTAADVESAGRSCLAMVVLAAIILALLLLWIVVRSAAGG